VRTDPEAPKHKASASCSSPLRPSESSAGRSPTCTTVTIWIQRGVLPPTLGFPPRNLVGELHGGWRVANGSLGHERTMLWMSFADRLRDLVQDIRPATAIDRDHYATLVMDDQALRLLGSAALARASRGEEDVAAVVSPEGAGVRRPRRPRPNTLWPLPVRMG